MAMNAEAFTLLNTYQQGNVARAGGSEILSYTTHDNTVLSTVGLNHTTNSNDVFGVQIMTLSSAGALSERDFIDLKTTFGGDSANMLGLSSVAADTQNRGFGAAALIPTANTTTTGKVVLYDYTAGFSGGSRVLATLDVGFHPDSVSFSADGTKLFVVNEGEFNGATNAPGSISVIDLTGVTNTAGAAALTGAAVTTRDFSAANLTAGIAELQGVRNPSAATSFTTVPNFSDTAVYEAAGFANGIEPEFAAQIGNNLYVTLQENNAIGVYNLTTNKWDDIYKLGTITQTIDASDRDTVGNNNPLLSINDTVTGLPMPDTLKAFTVGANKYLITANEGDARIDDADILRFGTAVTTDTDAGTAGVQSLVDSSQLAKNTDDGVNGLARLNISRINGDTDLDGDIDNPTMIGTRSFSIWDADTGALVYDSGSLESVLSGLDPSMHNTNGTATGTTAANMDNRSDDKGPEPEALTIGEIAGQMYAFIGMERQNGLLMYNISDPNNPYFVGYTNAAASGLTSPENMLFIAAADSPTGTALLLTGHEGFTAANGDVTVSGISVHAVPEPSRALLGMLGLAFIALRRRRA
jgi:MYXO-CTERM domain-containing protein